MIKDKKRKKPPSRKRYEEEHPAISFRLDKETKKCLEEHLEGTGCSNADFIKDALGREESMIERRIEIMALRKINSSLEERVKYLEDFIYQIHSMPLYSGEEPPFCPRCDNQELVRCEGREMESTLAVPWVLIWECPKCGFFTNTYKRVDPKSIKRS